MMTICRLSCRRPKSRPPSQKCRPGKRWSRSSVSREEKRKRQSLFPSPTSGLSTGHGQLLGPHAALTLFFQNFVLFPEILDVLLVRRVFPPHRLDVLSSLLQDLGPRRLPRDARSLSRWTGAALTHLDLLAIQAGDRVTQASKAVFDVVSSLPLQCVVMCPLVLSASSPVGPASGERLTASDSTSRSSSLIVAASVDGGREGEREREREGGRRRARERDVTARESGWRLHPVYCDGATLATLYYGV